MSARAAIRGLGMITSVGNDVVSSCAAVRAGLSRPGPLPYKSLDLEALANEPVPGHPVRPLTLGFEGLAVHALLAQCALRDLARNARLDEMGPADWQETALFVCRSPARAVDPEDREEIDAELEDLPDAIGSSGEIGEPGRGIFVSTAGHAAVLLAAQQALAAIEKGELERAILLGIDSLVGEDEVAYLAEQDRLKTPDNPVGLMPGQAAAALLLEAEHARRVRGTPPLAFLTRVAAQTVEPVREDAMESDGRGLARAVADALGGAQGFVEIYGDLNGEHWRAQEWGATLLHLRKARVAEDHALVLPATELGDTGAASGAVSLCVAVRALVRGYARAPRAVVWSRSDESHVAAALVETASTHRS
jgi:3-oxoacyl-[acyl-carrier-protein] synthase I